MPLGALRLASSNAHKARELERALPGWTVELLEADEFPPEDGETYFENALIKARFGRSWASPDELVLGEDSGIEAAVLGGRPGIHSARWGKPGSSVDRLLRELEGKNDRRARYVCELVCLLPDGTELRARGTLEGEVVRERRGTGGFGYDPVFVPEGETSTVAELGDEWKATNSHRARAALKLLEEFLGG
ncbi:MAG: non-canonical purine NTP pyrophosphatase [Actinobacteria bacterium]|nr:non-canonical purine NTP pyrophosphatase [Actinomycetota bacterium]